jgi:glyoxylase-like metal-dependent hydrolase (beta-lactamase superfamily II)/predicted ester cyclase
VATTDDPAARPRSSKAATTKVVRAYLRALSDHDLDAAVACWAPGGREVVHGQVDTTAPDGVRAYFAGLIDAFPDLRFEELAVTAEADRCSVRSRMTATFAGRRAFNGIAPNGARIDLEVVDSFVVRDGLIVANDAYLDGMTVARQIGLLPPAQSGPEQAMTRAFNVRTKAAGKTVSGLEKVADGVWRLRGGFPAKDFNVYLIEEGDGVTVFDGGIRAMTKAVAHAGARLGGIKRVVLGHAHPDHRGIAPGLGVPVLVHPADRADAEGDGGLHGFHLERLAPVVRSIYPHLLKAWDGGPVTIAGTVDEGDEIAGFRVVHLPGHAPGLIALFRDEDRLALTSDAFYLLNVQTGRPTPPSVPHPAFNADDEQARASLRKLADLGPAAAWPGHLGPLTGDVAGQLRAAADRAS